MVGKMTKNEKILASLSLAVLVIAIIVKCFIGTTDTGVLVMLSFTGILMWLIILFCAFFPEDLDGAVFLEDFLLASFTARSARLVPFFCAIITPPCI